ncbi:MAG: permease [Candidatus Thorarchaeota archaeon]
MVVEYLFHYFTNFLTLLIEIAPWMILGFVVAAFIEEFVSTDRMSRYFGSNDLASLGRATFAGLFMSICSCGAIPLVVSIRRKGASTATALTFLLAAPWAGLAHLFIMMGFVGPVNVIILFILSMIVALGTGVCLSYLENHGKIEASLTEKEIIEVESCYAPHYQEPLPKRLFFCIPQRMWDLFKDVGKYLFFGLLIAALLAAFIPISVVQLVFGWTGPLGIVSILIALPIAAVLELCAEGLTILAGQLYLMGASLGVIFTITLVGVSTDFTELSMIWGKFGKKSAIAYLGISTIFVVLLAFGLVMWWPF